MKRLGGRLVVLLIVLLVVVAPALVSDVDDDSAGGSEPTRITSYDAEFTVAEDGDLDVVETIVVEFPGWPERHGIFRYWDTWDPAATFKRRIPHDISITQDGSPASVKHYTENHDRHHVARVGSEWSTMSEGEHTYVIRYSIRGVVEEGKDVDAASQFYWNLIPGGWAQEIDKATLHVNLPAEVEGVQCAVGFGNTGGCSAQGDGTDEITVNVANLDARTPVTIKAGLDMETPATGDTRPWPYRWDAVFGTTGSGVLVVTILALLAGLFGWWRARTAYEEEPPYPLQYGPPPGVGPAQAAYILTEGVPRTALVATLLHMAESGLATLDRKGDKWSLTSKDNPEDWAGSDTVTRSIASILSPTSGVTFTSGSADVESGEKLRTAVSRVKADTERWAIREGHMEPSGLGTGGGLAVVLAAIATLALVLFNPFRMSMVALIPGLFLVGAMYLASAGSGTRRTPSGRDLWSRLGGFRRVLSTPSSEDRFDFSGRKELYTAYIPWAVAFGVAEEWAKKYRIEVGEEPPVPSYFGSAYGHSTGIYLDSMVNSFDRSIASSISAYEASIAPPPSSSGGSSWSSGGGWSGGGGGFSGGGGGGGGGGGSW